MKGNSTKRIPMPRIAFPPVCPLCGGRIVKKSIRRANWAHYIKTDAQTGGTQNAVMHYGQGNVTIAYCRRCNHVFERKDP